MGNFAPMRCKFCGSGPYGGPTLGDSEDDPHSKYRTYDCESSYNDHRLDTWNVTTRCAELARARIVEAVVGYANRIMCDRNDVLAIAKHIEDGSIFRYLDPVE